MAKETITQDAVETTPATDNSQALVESQAVTTEIVVPSEPRAESRAKKGDIKTEMINTCVEIIPTKGSNAGRQMYLINGKHWSRHAPGETHNTIVLEFTTWTNGDGTLGTGYNVVGFNTDSRTLSIDQKISKITSFDASYSQALAILLK